MGPTRRRTLGKSGVAVSALGGGGGPLGDMYALLDEAAGTLEASFRTASKVFETSPF